MIKFYFGKLFNILKKNYWKILSIQKISVILQSLKKKI
jgi:hypothetical protein